MARVPTRHKLILAAASALLLGGTISACTNNPFNPSADMRVMEVKSSLSGEGRFIGIRQSASTEKGVSFTLYTYSDPVVILKNRDGLPSVDFKSFTVKVTLSDGTIMPLKEYPLSKASVDAANLEIQFPILSIDTDIRNVVYPGNNAPRVGDGFADVALKGTDTNGNPIRIDFSVPLRFESLIYSDSQTPPELSPTPNPETPNTDGGQ